MPSLAGTQENGSARAVPSDNSYTLVKHLFIETLLGWGDTAGERQSPAHCGLSKNPIYWVLAQFHSALVMIALWYVFLAALSLLTKAITFPELPLRVRSSIPSVLKPQMERLVVGGGEKAEEEQGDQRRR